MTSNRSDWPYGNPSYNSFSRNFDNNSNNNWDNSNNSNRRNFNDFGPNLPNNHSYKRRHIPNISQHDISSDDSDENWDSNRHNLMQLRKKRRKSSRTDSLDLDNGLFYNNSHEEQYYKEKNEIYLENYVKFIHFVNAKMTDDKLEEFDKHFFSFYQDLINVSPSRFKNTKRKYARTIKSLKNFARSHTSDGWSAVSDAYDDMETRINNAIATLNDQNLRPVKERGRKKKRDNYDNRDRDINLTRRYQSRSRSRRGGNSYSPLPRGSRRHSYSPTRESETSMWINNNRNNENNNAYTNNCNIEEKNNKKTSIGTVNGVVRF